MNLTTVLEKELLAQRDMMMRENKELLKEQNKIKDVVADQQKQIDLMRKSILLCQKAIRHLQIDEAKTKD